MDVKQNGSNALFAGLSKTFLYHLGVWAVCVACCTHAEPLPQPFASLLHFKQNMGAGLADALQDGMHCLQVANMKNWQFQLDVAYT